MIGRVLARNLSSNIENGRTSIACITSSIEICMVERREEQKWHTKSKQSRRD